MLGTEPNTGNWVCRQTKDMLTPEGGIKKEEKNECVKCS